MIAAVLWDLDGTLVDSQDLHWRAWRETMASEGVFITHEQFLATFGLRNDAILPHWLGHAAAPESIQRIADSKEACYRRLVSEDARRGRFSATPGAAAWVERLHRDGWLQAIASSAPRLNVDVVLDALGLTQNFQAIVSAEDVHHGKPDPEVFLAAAGRLGAPPPRCIVVEDAAAGVEAARRAGMRSIGLARAGSTLAADVAVPSLAELPPDAFTALLNARLQ